MARDNPGKVKKTRESRVKSLVAVMPDLLVCDYEGCKKPGPWKRNYDFRRHQRTHNKVRENRCPVEGCPFTAHQKGGIKQHMSTHDPTKKVPCPTCGASLSDASALTRHKKSQHSNERASMSEKTEPVMKAKTSESSHILPQPPVNTTFTLNTVPSAFRYYAPVPAAPAPLPYYALPSYYDSDRAVGAHRYTPESGYSSEERGYYYSSSYESSAGHILQRYSPSDRSTASPVEDPDDDFYEPPSSPEFGFPHSQERYTFGF